MDQDNNVKISDFGCCIHTERLRNTVLGTFEYICTEMVNSESYGFGADVYCLGIVLYELFYFKSPFHAENKDDIISNISKGVISFPDSREVPSAAK